MTERQQGYSPKELAAMPETRKTSAVRSWAPELRYATANQILQNQLDFISSHVRN